MITRDHRPLAERLRPVSLEEIIGQEHLVGPGGILQKAVKAGSVPSIIFWGPPGVGKTTIANIIANTVKMPFHILSAISSGVKDVREVIQKAKYGGKSILFIDEIHRFSKSQQDALLAAVEKGQISLIGATTENPSFEVNAALLSRCQVYRLKPMDEAQQKRLIESALEKDEYMRSKQIALKETGALLQLAGGDGRKLLNLLELAVESVEIGGAVTNDVVVEVAQQKVAVYDKSGEQHYDIISAFIKSIRGSDPNAALYYLARMIEGGEDLKFIARRLLISASEDIGLANPTALVMATNTFQAVTMIGYPEAEIILSQCTIYLASSAKSNASYMAIKNARRMVAQTGDLPVPMHLRNAPTKLMKEEGYGKGYLYAHDFPGNFAQQEFMPDQAKGSQFYFPGKNAREEEMRKKLKQLWQQKYDY